MVGCAGESYALVITSTEGGNVTSPGEGIFVYDEGTVVNLTAEAEEGYYFVNWTGNVSTIVNCTAPSTNITMNDDFIIRANFVRVYNLTISSTAGGNVTVPGEGTFTYDTGTVVDLVATPDAGYRFVNWTGDVSTIADVTAVATNITMNGNYSITAKFEEEVVTLPDPNLEAAIREAIGKPNGSIYPSDLAGLTQLNVSYRDIADLTGLQYCVSLAVLDIAVNRISDVSPLTSLVNLTHLYLWANEISNISAVGSLVNVTVLFLNQNHVNNISVLGSLTGLTGLELSYNEINDISPLASLTSLTGLGLGGNQIGDVSPLVQNEGLAEGDTVTLYDNPLSSDSISIYIPQLRARGVTVYWP